LDNYKDGLILDEAQYVPEIFTYLKTAVDLNPVPGRFVVTGSQQFSMLTGVTESLAGRAAFRKDSPGRLPGPIYVNSASTSAMILAHRSSAALRSWATWTFMLAV